MTLRIERRAQGLCFSLALGRTLAGEAEPGLAGLLAAPLPGNARLAAERGALVLRATLAGAASSPERRARLAGALAACATRICDAGSGGKVAEEKGEPSAGEVLEALALAARGRGWTVTEEGGGLALGPHDAALRRARVRAFASAEGVRLEALLPASPLALVPALRAALALNGCFFFARLRLRAASERLFAVETVFDEADEEELAVGLEAVACGAVVALRLAALLEDGAVAREYEFSRGLGGAEPGA